VSFTAIEERISPYINTSTSEILHENLESEVKQTVTDPNKFALWQQAQQGTMVLSREFYPSVEASYDMAWQQRNSGNRYNSLQDMLFLLVERLGSPLRQQSKQTM
jgi:hypothetical protein